MKYLIQALLFLGFGMDQFSISNTIRAKTCALVLNRDLKTYLCKISHGQRALKDCQNLNLEGNCSHFLLPAVFCIRGACMRWVGLAWWYSCASHDWSKMPKQSLLQPGEWANFLYGTEKRNVCSSDPKLPKGQMGSPQFCYPGWACRGHSLF